MKEHSSMIKPAKKILLSEDETDRGDYSEIAEEKLIEGEKRYLYYVCNLISHYSLWSFLQF